MISKHHSEAEVLELLSGENFKKKFLKQKCEHGDCGARFRQRFGKSSGLVLKAQISIFWCKDCGRLLCQKHRSDHECEAEKFRLALLKNLSAEEVLKAVQKEQARKDFEEKIVLLKKRAEREVKAAQYQVWKERRQLAAKKASQVTSFVQRVSLQTDYGRIRDQLLNLYTSCNRISLRMQNAVNSPSSQFDFESYKELVDNYKQIKDISGMICLVDGMPLNLSLTWVKEDAQTPQEEDAASSSSS